MSETRRIGSLWLVAQINDQLPSFRSGGQLFGFQATAIVQDVCADEDDPKQTLAIDRQLIRSDLLG
jgi:hypothetical protein